MHLRMKCLKLWFQHTAARRRLRICQKMKSTICEFQHTAARRRLSVPDLVYHYDLSFQHTAARRRLVHDSIASVKITTVSTHSRPKAAEAVKVMGNITSSFNTQPPEGGCISSVKCLSSLFVSTHSRPKAAGPFPTGAGEETPVSTHSRPKAAAHTLTPCV